MLGTISLIPFSNQGDISQPIQTNLFTKLALYLEFSPKFIVYYYSSCLCLQSHLESNLACLLWITDKNRVDDSVKKQLPSVLKDDETFNAINAQDATFRLDVNVGTKFADVEKAVISTLKDGKGIIEKKTEYEKECRNDEIKGINSMVQSKQEEAKLLQKRAEETHREAMSLQHALSSERERIEHEFYSTYAKLRLNEAEKKRMKMLEDMQILEKAKHDYQKMKMMMEVQIKNLLMTMDIMKWHYA